MSSIFGNQQDIPETVQLPEAAQVYVEELSPIVAEGSSQTDDKDVHQSLETEGKIKRSFKKFSLGKNLPSSIPLIFRNNYEYDATTNTLKLKQDIESESKLQVYTPAASLIQGIKKPIAVVSICGRYRSGKSYFLSRMLGSHDAFSLGHTMHACTFGIWMGTTVLECDDYVVLLLDTEGIDAVGTTGSSDASVLVMTILLSSYMIYNSLQVPTRGDLEKMSCFTELSRSISIRSGEENEDLTDFRLHFPDFLWLLRDVTLDTTDEISGKQITPTEYLKTKVLARSKKAVPTVADNVVMCIRNYFPTIECKTLPPPTANKAIMHSIAERADELFPEFLTSMEEVVDYVMHTAKVKKGFNNSTVVDGSLLSQLSHEYLEAVNSPNAIPTLDMTWQNVINTQLIAITKELLGKYEKEMIKKLKQMYPLEVGRKDDGSLGATTLIGIHERVLDKQRKRFVKEMKTLLPINMNEKLTVKSFEARKADYLASLELQIVTYEEVVDDDGCTTERVADGILFKFIQRNYDESVTYCTRIFQELFEPIEKKIKEALKSSDDDIQYTFPHLQSDAEKMHDDYYRKARGPAKEFVFIEKKENILDRQLQVYETMVGFSKQVLKARQEAFEAIQQANEAKQRIDELEKCIQQLEQKLLLKQPELDEVIREQQRVIKELERDLNQQIEEEKERFEELSQATELQDKISADASKQKIKEMEDMSNVIIEAMKQEHEKRIGGLAQDISDTKEKLEKFVAMYSRGETNPDRPESHYVGDDKKGKKKLFGLQLKKPQSSKSKEIKQSKDSNEGEAGETESNQDSTQHRRWCIIL